MIAQNTAKPANKSCVKYVCFREDSFKEYPGKEYLRKNGAGNWEAVSKKEATRFTSKTSAREAIRSTWTKDWRIARVTSSKYSHGPWSVYEDVFLAKMMRKCERCAYTEPLQSDKTRYARGYVLLDPSDCDPPHGLDLAPGSRDSLKVEKLEKAFRTKGFSKKKPALVGYPRDGRIQLVSGTHRHEAARRAGIMLPVKIMIRSEVEAIWGTPQWEDFLKDIPVEKLERVSVKEPTPAPGLDERVDLSRDLVLETADGRCGVTYGGSGSCSLQPEHAGSHYCELTRETFTASSPSEVWSAFVTPGSKFSTAGARAGNPNIGEQVDTKETNATESSGAVVGRQLSWRDVLDCKIWYGVNYKMAKVADGAGYKYFVWNDRVYEIIKSQTKFDDYTWEDRGMVSDLVK